MKKPLLHSAPGSVLIIVLVVCVGLVSLALVFGHSMMMAYRGADNNLAGRQAEEAVEAGARYAEYLIANVTSPGSMPDPAAYQGEELPVGDATFWFIGEPGPTDPVDTPAFGLVDEASKLNLNTASESMLEALPGMTPDLAAAIVQWRNTNADQSASSGGTTISMTPVKNAPFESVEELALLSGTDMSILYGEDANLNHVLDSNEDDGDKTPPSDNADGKLDSGLLEYVTVFSREPNTRSDGTPRINVTTASLVAPLPSGLKALLTGTLGSARANEIERLIRNSFASGPVGSVLDFVSRANITDTEYAKIYQDITMKGGAFVPGLINVNTASETVLTCVPGIGADKASQLVATRSNAVQPPTGLAWVVPILGAAGIKQAGKYLTSQTYQVSADVAAVGRYGRGYRRTQFIIDSSSGTPRIVYRRNLASLGWALGSDVREMLATKKTSQ